MPSTIGFTRALENRLFNITLLNRIGEEFSSLLDGYNKSNNEHTIKASWDYFGGDNGIGLTLEMTSGEPITDTAELFINGDFSSILSEWFGAEYYYEPSNEGKARIPLLS
jgi:hypothetical protein